MSVHSSEAASAMWYSTFETGSYRPYFNSNLQIKCGAVDTVSNALAHSGSFSGYDFYTGGPAGTSCRAYPSEQLFTKLASFQLDIWVYVPHVALNDWVSIVTLRLDDDTFITIDSNKRQELHLWNGALSMDRSIYQTKPIKWPFDKWFKVGVLADLKPGTMFSKITVYQDNDPIITYIGYAGTGTLWRMHFGLYIGPKQGAFAVYNDDIILKPIDSGAVYENDITPPKTVDGETMAAGAPTQETSSPPKTTSVVTGVEVTTQGGVAMAGVMGQTEQSATIPFFPFPSVLAGLSGVASLTILRKRKR